MKFTDFPLDSKIQSALAKIGYDTPTPIQEEAIPYVLEKIDLLAIAQTGTGKTAAFCLPILNNLAAEGAKASSKKTKTLILTPTRELAIQIYENLVLYGQNLNQKYAVIFGGVSQGRQVQAMQKGPHVLVATPGRLLDLINQKHIMLDEVSTFILDEADRMLDMGFMNDIKKVLKLLPSKRHNLFFSATMPKEIESLAKTILNNPHKVEITPESTTVERISQSVMYVDKPQKTDLLVHILKEKTKENPKMKTLVFVEMKHVANRITETLEKSGISCAAIHGNKSQGARQRALKEFTDGDVSVLVATDIASRGIDVDGITHVINYELSNIMESYVHRVGRTARAGKDGAAISLVTADEKSYLKGIEASTNQKIPVERDHPHHSDAAESAPTVSVGKAKAKMEAERKANRPPRGGGKKRPQGGGRNQKKASGSKSSGAGSSDSRPSRKKPSSPKKASSGNNSSSSSSKDSSSSDSKRPARRGY
jgi:ATP-dependent RNA helicase RhlE